MKKALLLKILFVLAFTITIWAGATINGGLNVTNNNGIVTIQFTTDSESNVKDFIVERSTSPTDWSDAYKVRTFSPRGAGSTYSCTDDPVSKTTGFTFYYRLEIDDNDSSISYLNASNPISLSNLSGVKQTWGSIKAMFR